MLAIALALVGCVQPPALVRFECREAVRGYVFAKTEVPGEVLGVKNCTRGISCFDITAARHRYYQGVIVCTYN